MSKKEAATLLINTKVSLRYRQTDTCKNRGNHKEVCGGESARRLTESKSAFAFEAARSRLRPLSFVRPPPPLEQPFDFGYAFFTSGFRKPDFWSWKFRNESMHETTFYPLFYECRLTKATKFPFWDKDSVLVLCLFAFLENKWRALDAKNAHVRITIYFYDFWSLESEKGTKRFIKYSKSLTRFSHKVRSASVWFLRPLSTQTFAALIRLVIDGCFKPLFVYKFGRVLWDPDGEKSLCLRGTLNLTLKSFHALYYLVLNRAYYIALLYKIVLNAISLN